MQRERRERVYQHARGALDFECYEWTNPLCVGMAWGDSVSPHTHFIEGLPPEAITQKCLLELACLSKAGICNTWYAHNGGKYDVLFLVDGALKLNWRMTGIIANSRALEIVFTDSNGTQFKVRDTYALVPSGLKHCATDFELPDSKLFTEEDYSVDTRTWSKQKLRNGCLIDCKLVLQLLDKVEEQVTEWNGSMKLTFSGTAFDILKQELSSASIDIPCFKDSKASQAANTMAREAYHGGRCEVLHHCPKHSLVEYDVNSSYPWSMTQPHPWNYLGALESVATIEKHLLSKDCPDEGVIHAHVSVPIDMEIPPLPFKHEKKLFFPVGDWTAWFTARELRYARSIGITVKPIQAFGFSRERLFDTFINRLYALKSKSKGALRNFAKLCLNGCYGRWGMKPERESLLILPTEYEAASYLLKHPPDTISQLSADMRALIIKKETWHSASHFALAAYVTAQSRILLHKGMVASKGCAYVDTDSIHCQKSIFPGPLGAGLGEWKLERQDYKAQFFAPKIYKLKHADGSEYLASKGFQVDSATFDRIIENETASHNRMMNLKSQLRQGEGVKRINDAKRWLGMSAKRRPIKSGATFPWSVDEIIAGRPDVAESPLRKRAN